MRRRSVVAIAALITAFALAGMPNPAASVRPSIAVEPAPAAFSTLTIPANSPAQRAPGLSGDALSAADHLDAGTRLAEPGIVAVAPRLRPIVAVPAAPSGEDWKAPRQVLKGQATFYDNGTTAMRLPRGTVVRICGNGGCIERVVNDYGPQKKSRVVDLYTPDFFAICGCGSWSGVTNVTVYVY